MHENESNETKNNEKNKIIVVCVCASHAILRHTIIVLHRYVYYIYILVHHLHLLPVKHMQPSSSFDPLRKLSRVISLTHR